MSRSAVGSSSHAGSSGALVGSPSKPSRTPARSSSFHPSRSRRGPKPPEAGEGWLNMEAPGKLTASGMFVCPEGELSELEVAAARRGFDAYDIDGDGVVSRLDFHNAMSKYRNEVGVGVRTNAELDAMFASIDIDGTGQVDFLKFAVCRVRKNNQKPLGPDGTTKLVSEDKSKMLESTAQATTNVPAASFFAKLFSGGPLCCAQGKTAKKAQSDMDAYAKKSVAKPNAKIEH